MLIAPDDLNRVRFDFGPYESVRRCQATRA